MIFIIRRIRRLRMLPQWTGGFILLALRARLGSVQVRPLRFSRVVSGGQQPRGP